MTRFADLIGQDLASNALRKAVRTQRINHAYLFSGSEGSGKLTAAKAFAAALFCENRVGGEDACGECAPCRMMDHSNYPDIEIISPDGAQTKIEQMRKMRRESNFAPVRGDWKIVIVEQADTLNEDSSNSILKILEEPPNYLVIILLSRNPALLLATIRSRCQLVRFSHVSHSTLADALVERFDADREQAEFFAAYSEGRPGVAISLLQDEGFYERRRRILDFAKDVCASDRGHSLRLSDVLQSLASDDTSGVNKRASTKIVFDTLTLWYRDLLSLAIRGEAADIVNRDERDALASCRMVTERISRSIEALIWAKRALESNGNTQLISNVTMMRLLS